MSCVVVCHNVDDIQRFLFHRLFKDNKVLFCEAAAPKFTKPDTGVDRSRKGGNYNCVVKPKELANYQYINYGINYNYLASNHGNWYSTDVYEFVTQKMERIKNPDAAIGQIIAAVDVKAVEVQRLFANAAGADFFAGLSVLHQLLFIKLCHTQLCRFEDHGSSLLYC